MPIFIYLIIFIFGLIIGSFLFSIICYLEGSRKILLGRSFCPFCKHKLSWQDLIPVMSFILLKGKCRYCHKKISIQYPLIEIATGLTFLLIVIFIFGHWNLGFDWSLGFGNWDFLYYLVISCFLILIFVFDLKHYIIPDKLIYPAITITFLYQLFSHWDFNALINPLLSAFFASFFFLSIFLISRGRWMGFGDVKLAFLLGLILGWPNILVALFLAFFIGAIIGLILIAANKKTINKIKFF